nr:zinc finger BED domain-containing protein RICESLEEPER 2-like [Tanacetum cinerariifolium]
MSDNTKKAQCIHCFCFFSKYSNSTLKNHISHQHCEALKRVSESGQSSISRDGSIFVYNLDVLREQFASLVIQRGLPFNHFDDEQTTRVFQKHLQPKYNHEGLYNNYFAKYSNPTTESSSETSSSKANGGNQMSRLLNRLQEYTKSKAMNDPSLSSEYERYVTSEFVKLLDNSAFTTFDLLGFWKAKESMFPVLSRMTMDIISVQATSVASESTFLTKHKQHKSGLENPIDFKEEILDADVQQNEVIPLSKEEIAIDVASSEDTMCGSGSGGKEVDYDMTNYGYDDYE